MKVILLSIYGYSNLFLVFGSLLATFPFVFLQWVFMALGGAVAIFFLMRTAKNFINKISKKKKIISLIGLLILQALVYLSYKMMFF